MAQHVLSLEVSDTLNKTILRIMDSSVYSAATVTCPILQVTLPGFNSCVVFNDSFLQPGFNLNLTACDLEVQSTNCGTKFNDLPDGVYIIRYSVSPNNSVYVEYNHLRITKALNKYYKILCDLDIAACDPPEIVKEKLKQLNLIKMYLDAAKAQVEFCHHPGKGTMLFNWAVKLLNKFTCSTC